MQPYMLLAVVIRLVVDFMLLYAAKRLFSPYPGLLRPLLGAAVGGIYAAGCLILQLSILQSPLCYWFSMLLSCLIAFGVARIAVSSAAVYILLRLALDGLASGESIVVQLFLGILLCVLSLLGFGGRLCGRRYVPVELCYGGKRVKLQALWDTGHELCDPVTGKGVLVVGADVARLLTGLEVEQLRQPVEAIQAIPGLRLIPYQTVESSGRMMLCLVIPDTKIGRKRGPCLVAFAPQVLDGNGKYQALIGGTV